METIKTLESPEQILAEHRFLQDLEPRYLQFIAECASERHFAAGEYILLEGEPANHLYLINQGKVALGTLIPNQGFTTVETLGAGEALGWSWLIPPYHWHFTGLTILPTWVTILDGKRLREKCEADHDFGYELLKRLASVVGQRLRMIRMRLG